MENNLILKHLDDPIINSDHALSKMLEKYDKNQYIESYEEVRYLSL